jgi:hypothetical protein
MISAYLELVEQLHLYISDGKPLFAGTPDRVLRFPKQGVTVLFDFKFGRLEVPSADINMQLRAYLSMIPAAEFDDGGVPYGYSEHFRPSSLLRLKLCPGSLDFERSMASRGLTDPEPTEYSMEGALLHKAIAEPLAPRDYLTPEALETVEKAERMVKEFIDFVLASNPILPFYGAIVQPRTSRNVDSVAYTDDDIVKARMEINGIWDVAHHEGAPRNASSDACRFCPCKALCPEYRSWVLAVEKIQHLPAATWDDEQWDLFLSRCGELNKFIEDRKNDAKAIKAANPERLPGWTLKDGDEVRHVSDIPLAWTALSELLNAKDFSAACRISLGDIEETLWRIRKDTPRRITQREAKAIVNAKLGALVSLKQKAPSLVRKKPDA